MEEEIEASIVLRYIEKERYDFGHLDPRQPLTDFSQTITKHLEPLFSSILGFPSVLCTLVAHYLSPSIDIFLQHRKWNSQISLGCWRTYGGYSPTIQNPSNLSHWSEAIFEAYTETAFLQLAFPETEFQKVAIPSPFSIFLPVRKPTRDHDYTLYVLRRKGQEGIYDNYWIYIQKENLNSISLETGDVFHGWKIIQLFRIKLLNPNWICEQCSCQNQRLQHGCVECLASRFQADSSYVPKWKKRMTQKRTRFPRLSVCYGSNPYFAYYVDRKERALARFWYQNHLPLQFFQETCLFCYTAHEEKLTTSCSSCERVFFCNKECEEKARPWHSRHCKRDKFRRCAQCLRKVNRCGTAIPCWNCPQKWCSSACWTKSFWRHIPACLSTVWNF